MNLLYRPTPLAARNTAIGSPTLSANTTGYANTAVGTGALDDNTTGHYNTAIGGALLNNSTGDNNTATGVQALNNNTTGGNNTAFGTAALFLNGTGSGNIALGYQAGSGVPVGNSNSIYVGSIGSPSDASGTIQIGTQGTQTGGTFIAGISGATSSSGVEVFIDEIGQLGTMTSSGRFKEQITDMGDTQQQTAPVASGELSTTSRSTTMARTSCNMVWSPKKSPRFIPRWWRTAKTASHGRSAISCSLRCC